MYTSNCKKYLGHEVKLISVSILVYITTHAHARAFCTKLRMRSSNVRLYTNVCRAQLSMKNYLHKLQLLFCKHQLFFELCFPVNKQTSSRKRYQLYEVRLESSHIPHSAYTIHRKWDSSWKTATSLKVILLSCNAPVPTRFPLRKNVFTL